jgi:hypothetical protein
MGKRGYVHYVCTAVQLQRCVVCTSLLAAGSHCTVLFWVCAIENCMHSSTAACHCLFKHVGAGFDTLISSTWLVWILPCSQNRCHNHQQLCCAAGVLLFCFASIVLQRDERQAVCLPCLRMCRSLAWQALPVFKQALIVRIHARIQQQHAR